MANSVTSVDAANTASAVPGSVGMFALPDVVTVVAPLIAPIDAAVDSQTPVPSPDRSRARRERVVHSTAIVATPRQRSLQMSVPQVPANILHQYTLPQVPQLPQLDLVAQMKAMMDTMLTQKISE